jgi:hypothetical protein
LDGEGEYIFQGERLNCYIKSRGAGVFELDYLPRTWNYLDTFTGGDRGIGQRSAFADYLAPEGQSLPLAENSRFCSEEYFDILEADHIHTKAHFHLGQNSALPFGSIEIEKTYHLKNNILKVEYALKNCGSSPESFMLIPGLDLSFPGEGEPFTRILALREEGKEHLIPVGSGFSPGYPLEVKNALGLEFQDLKNEALIILEVNRVFDARISCIKTGGSETEAGEYQSHWILPRLPVTLGPGETWGATLTLKISS